MLNGVDGYVTRHEFWMHDAFNIPENSELDVSSDHYSFE